MKFCFELWTASTNTCNDRESLKSEFSHNSFWHVFDSWPAVTTKLLCVTCSFFRAATSDSGLANYTGSLEKTQMKQIDSADIPNTKSNNYIRNKIRCPTCPELAKAPWLISAKTFIAWKQSPLPARRFTTFAWASQQPSALPASKGCCRNSTKKKSFVKPLLGNPTISCANECIFELPCARFCPRLGAMLNDTGWSNSDSWSQKHPKNRVAWRKMKTLQAPTHMAGVAPQRQGKQLQRLEGKLGRSRQIH